jgi:acetyl esterase/lipase
MGLFSFARLEVVQEDALKLEVAKDIKAPVLGLYGGKDAGIPLTDVDKMREALKATGSKSEFVVYPDAGHGFHAGFRPDNYRKQDAGDGWNRMLARFKLWGVAQRRRRKRQPSVASVHLRRFYLARGTQSSG